MSVIIKHIQNMPSRYEYPELKKKVEADPKNQKLLQRMTNWFWAYDSFGWNGEYYDCEDFRIYPVYRFFDDEDKEPEFIKWELRY